MSEPALLLRVAGSDEEERSLWEAAFSAEGWRHAFAPDLSQWALTSGDTGLLLVAARLLGEPNAPARERLAQQRVSYIVFGQRGRISDAEIIRHLEQGADDFLDCRSDPRLLCSRLRAHLRRLSPAIALELELLWSPKREIKCHPRERRAWMREGGRLKPLPNLTATECDLLCLFLRHPAAALERRFILENLWRGEAGEVNPENVDKHVESLRRKLGAKSARIRTIYGVGYAYSED